MEQAMRDKFEAWVTAAMGGYADLRKSNDPNFAYDDADVDFAYQAWKASHTQAAWDGCKLAVDLFESGPSARQGTNLRAMFEETNKGKFPRRSFERDKFGDYVDRSAEFAWKSLLSTLGHAERLQALERLRLRIDAHMFIREDGELLGYGVTVPEMREFRELLIPFNGEIKIK
ncbi:hypothetical protein IPC367_27210 [Pseudomonas aeruginosa]|uniref:hypothetical protein n=1 Tax=Pseudomonas aeruginosa TaxID=287 RepID=UPI000FD42B3B|nr:hypothetical protein [Pseudomonas aeruginosa]MDU0791211.1 hypothetical protein [Pseudomonas aeruginosa]RUJ22077.1 hypothetical protein IPC367_27210 [Pseudomonas aeruginosa]HBO6815983.1 hypothetical protein [Pseudomonas aeruginosa]HCL3265850.1 hypothetical protein [Pseudomonas aeruginosa]